MHFVGVWDTVKSLVMNANKKFHNANLNPEVKFGYHALSIDEKRKDFPPHLWNENNIAEGQTIEQVWFAGVHADVGGWYDERGLSNIALRWMMAKAKKAGMQVDENLLEHYKENPFDKQHEEYRGFWKFRGRHIRKIPEGALVHHSVKKRIDKGIGYGPKNLPAHPKYVK